MMTGKVTVESGPARSGKTHRLLERYRAALRVAGPASAIGRGLWIAPTTRAATAVREQLLAEGIAACLGPSVVTFDQLTAAILVEGRASLRPLSACVERELLRRVVRQALERRELTYFADAARASGFIDLLIEHVRELKRREIDAAAFAKSSGLCGHEVGHRELEGLYAEYQRRLTDHALVDREGRHWIARDLLAADACPSLSRLELVVVDGFTDFTPTQNDVLQLLAARADELCISLPGDGEMEDRTDLFAKTAATLAELRRRHGGLEERRLAPRPTAWPALDHLAAHLLRNPRQVPAPGGDALGSLDRLEIVAAAGAHDEIVEIARRIKQRLVSRDGQTAAARPDDVVVVFRTLQQAAPRVREVFAEYGIPFALEASAPILHAPVVKTLLALLQLVEEDWPFRRVVAVLTNHSLAALGDGARQAADWLVRDLQIDQGRTKLVDRIQQLADTSESTGELSEHQALRAARAQAALPAIRRLADALDQLPDAASLTQWCEALHRLGGQLGLSPFDEPTVDQAFQPDNAHPDSALQDIVAWRCIARHFIALVRLDDQLREPGRPRPRSDESPQKLSRAELLRVLTDVAAHESLPCWHDDVGRVRVLSAATARTVAAKHLFLAGMSEQAFPFPEPAGRFYREAEYRSMQRVALQQAAGDGQAGVSRPQDEMLLFYEVLTRAEESLTISYPALDDKAQPLPPSPYVTEIEWLLREANVAPRRSAPTLSPIPAGTAPLGPTDWRLSAVDRALSGEPALLAGLFSNPHTSAVGDAIDAGTRIVALRGPGKSFGPADGLLTGPAVAERLARRFGPQHLWSPSQWEQYAACPYKFFLKDVLGLEPLGELTLETDYGRRGGLLHHVLAKFHRAWREEEGARVLSSRDKEQFIARLREVLRTEVAAMPRSGIDAALLELDERQVAKWGEKYFEHYLSYSSNAAGLDEPLTPAHFEFRFGPPRPGEREGDDPDSKREPFELDIGGEKILVTGRIDRVDIGRAAGRTVFSVIDYKTGRRTSSLKAEQIASGERLQLPIYVAAAQSVLFQDGATPIAAGYWTMDRGFDRKGALNVLQGDADDAESTAEWDELRQTAVERVKEFVHSIRHGDFPVVSRDEHCTGRCEFSTVCRVAQVRAIGKTWPPE